MKIKTASHLKTFDNGKIYADKKITLAGNPNVGKSTLFNKLTGLKQHTGNWAGKTVGSAQGYYKSPKYHYILTDTPGTYSLTPHSAEEMVAGSFICFDKSDAVITVCDSSCLERNLCLVLQISEICENCAVCVNLMDEAERLGIHIDLPLLSKRLSMPVIPASASRKHGLELFKSQLDNIVDKKQQNHIKIEYPPEIETAISFLEPFVKKVTKSKINPRWLSLRLLENQTDIINEAEEKLGINITDNETIKKNLLVVIEGLEASGYDKQKLKDTIASTIVKTAHNIMKGVIKRTTTNNTKKDKLEKLLTGKYTAYPIMLLLLAVVFWITIWGANYPSALLSQLFEKLGNTLNTLLTKINTPSWLQGVLMDGAYKVSTWVIAVMLPPMAIFFPFFTILEDSGFLPRIAYNLDRPFKKCSACGKQALTMCMGFGCNAAGVTGARIIDSKRERLLAVLTNCFVPCNGKFPAIITLITLFFGFFTSCTNSILSAATLLVIVVFGILMTFIATKFLSSTLLRGMPSSFTLELPPYRKPKILEVVVRSVFDRTLFVLGRAVTSAIPAGIIIWFLANIQINNTTLLMFLATFFDPIGKFIGLDGIILLAFILGIPANEIVIPIMVMIYTGSNSLREIGTLAEIGELFLENGWTPITTICVIVFFLLHWPCATTLLTIKKETADTKWTLVSFLLPTVMGFLICMIISFIGRILQ